MEKSSPDTSLIRIPARDVQGAGVLLGITVLLFVLTMALFPLIFAESEGFYRIYLPLFVFPALLVFLIWYSTQHHMVLITPNEVTVKRFLKETRRIPASGATRVVLEAEEEKGILHGDVWKVSLLLDREGSGRSVSVFQDTTQMAVRSLAERLSKALKIPLEDRAFEGEPIVFSWEELDFPLARRVKAHPALLGKGMPPEYPGVRVSRTGSEESLSWGAATFPVIAQVLLTTLAFLVFLSSMPFLVREAEGAAGQLLPWWQKGYPILKGFTIAFPIVAILMVLGWRNTITISKKEVQFSESLWGLPVAVLSIPPEEVEEVGVHHKHWAETLQIISDKRIISCRTYFPRNNLDTLHWIAYEIRRALSEDSSS
ncbi:MAG: hypothetical protein HYU64_08180 [Armatimonadetes bacterium]|nr:hypothetical protein [Armatimonadota bacterium]